MRMQAYRMLLLAGAGDTAALPGSRLQQQVVEFDRTLALLRKGDPDRPLFVPWDDTVSQSFETVERDWARIRQRLETAPAPVEPAPALALASAIDIAAFATHIDTFVAAIETHLSRLTSVMHLLQIALMALFVLSAGVLLYLGYRFVLEPVSLLKQAIKRIQGGDLDARVECHTTDEFGTLAAGFNDMAAQLQSMYRSLESKVHEKTAQLEEKHGRLESLYEVTNLVTRALTLDELATHFTQAVARMARADGVALRWTDETNSRYLMLASHGLPASMVQAEHCVEAGDCHCGVPDAQP